MTTKGWLLVSITAVAVVATFTLSPAFPQYPSYFELADTRALFGIPNALDVLSNLPYLIVGLLGLRELSRWTPESPGAPHATHYRVFFIGITLTAFGSGYFHWAPSNETLVWDRLPMTILFMGFFGSVISELIDPALARRLLPALLIIGMGSVFYWGWTETQGVGDLRLYGLVQFLPVVLILTMLVLYEKPPGYAETIGYLVFCYTAAKVFEHFDHEIYAASGFISGHSLKHLISGLSGAFLLLWLRHRNETTLP